MSWYTDICIVLYTTTNILEIVNSVGIYATKSSGTRDE